MFHHIISLGVLVYFFYFLLLIGTMSLMFWLKYRRFSSFYFIMSNISEFFPCTARTFFRCHGQTTTQIQIQNIETWWMVWVGKTKEKIPKRYPSIMMELANFSLLQKSKKSPKEPSKFIGYLLKWDSSALTNSHSQMSGKSRLRNVFHGI